MRQDCKKIGIWLEHKQQPRKLESRTLRHYNVPPRAVENDDDDGNDGDVNSDGNTMMMMMMMMMMTMMMMTMMMTMIMTMMMMLIQTNALQQLPIMLFEV